jgi:hypothetical protein
MQLQQQQVAGFAPGLDVVGTVVFRNAVEELDSLRRSTKMRGRPPRQEARFPIPGVPIQDPFREFEGSGIVSTVERGRRIPESPWGIVSPGHEVDNCRRCE